MNHMGQIVACERSGPQHQVIRLNAPSIATQARPGHEIAIAGRRLPIIRSAPPAGWIECLCLADESPSLAVGKRGHQVELTLIQTRSFATETDASSALLIGEDMGLAAILFLGLTLATQRPIVLLGSHRHTFPFRPHPSRLLLPHLPGHVIATMPLLEEQKIGCRLACHDAPGCFDGYVVALAETWLTHCNQREREEVKVYACSESSDTAAAITALAKRFGMAHQSIALDR